MMMQRTIVVFVLLVVVFSAVYLFNIDGWLMHDDEGTDFYEVWQLQAGKEPGVDFIAEQQPLFLIVGSVIVEVWGKSAGGLRVLSAVQVIAGSLFLGVAVSHVWNKRVGILTMGFILTSGLVYEQARLFRPDPMMLAWELVGLGSVLLAAHKRDRRFWMLGGACYGVAVLWKPFGIFPVVGLVIYYFYWVLRSRDDRLAPIRNGIYFAVPFLLVSGGLTALLYSQLGFYYGEALSQHSALGEELGLPALGSRMVLGYLLFFLVNLIFIFLVPLWLLNRPKGWVRLAEHQLLFWQLFTPLIFLLVSRPLHVRYYFHLTPVFAILLAYQFDYAFERAMKNRPSLAKFGPLLGLILIVAGGLITRPFIPTLMVREETDTLEVANYIQVNTEPGQKVVSDYAGLNFFADRVSIYEASIIAGGRIDGGIITGELLIDQIKSNQVEMVVIHVEGGDPPAHQLVKLVDFDAFQTFLDENFYLDTVLDRAGQQLEVYRRN